MTPHSQIREQPRVCLPRRLSALLTTWSPREGILEGLREGGLERIEQALHEDIREDSSDE